MALELIRKLYAIERDLPPLLAPSDDPVAMAQRSPRETQRQQTRQRQAEPVLTELKQWLDEQRPKALPKSPLGQALGYALREALPGLFALGEAPTAEQLLAWPPDRWLLARSRASPEAAKAS